MCQNGRLTRPEIGGLAVNQNPKDNVDALTLVGRLYFETTNMLNDHFAFTVGVSNQIAVVGLIADRVTIGRAERYPDDPGECCSAG